MLEAADYRAILAVLDRTGRARTPDAFAEALLDGMQRELGYRGCSLMIADVGDDGPQATSGAIRGVPDRMEEYFERWRPSEPFEHPAALELLGRHGLAQLRHFHARLDRPQRIFCERFLAPDSIRDQLAAHIDTGLATQGFFSVYADEHETIGPRDRARLMAMRPLLAHQLRALALTGPTELTPRGTETTLSVRQREVASLAARGLRNAEIGASLGIAEATVKKHLVAVYRALGIRSRAELAARVEQLSS